MRDMTFASSRFYYNFNTGTTGTYVVEVTYRYDDKVFTELTSFDIAHLPEYDAFDSFDKYALYEFMRGNGSVVSDGIPSLEHDKNEITTYKKSYVIPLLVIAICVFVVDILIRKLRIGRKKKYKPSGAKGEKND